MSTSLFVRAPVDRQYFHAKHNQKTHGRRRRGGVLSEKTKDGWTPLAKSSGPATVPAQLKLGEAKAAYGDWRKGLSGDEVEALGGYAGVNYGIVNSTLRGTPMAALNSPKNRELAADRIKHIDTALAKSSVPQDVVAFRGIKVDGDPQKLVGKTIVDKGYVSTSLKKSGARPFAQKPGRRMAEVRVPKGAKGAYLGGLERLSGEAELLLPRNSKFLVTGVGTDGSLKLELVT